MSKDDVLDTRGLMAFLKIGRNKALELMRTEGFPAIQISPRRKVVPVDALLQWLKKLYECNE